MIKRTRPELLFGAFGTATAALLAGRFAQAAVYGRARAEMQRRHAAQLLLSSTNAGEFNPVGTAPAMPFGCGPITAPR